DGLPDGGGLLDRLLPGRGRVVRAHRLVEAARHPADVRPIGHEAVGDPAPVGPLPPFERREQVTVLQPLEGRANRSNRGRVPLTTTGGWTGSKAHGDSSTRNALATL